MKLLFDIGNSQIKYAYATDEGLSEMQAHDVDAEQLEHSFAQLSDVPEEVLIANVANPALMESIAIKCVERWQIKPRLATVEAVFGDLRLAYSNVQSFGVDRWLAMIAARATDQSASLVVDCGTATTIDAIDSSGQHLGGLILPGIATMMASLQSHTHRLPAVEQQSVSTTVLASNTADGILQGALTATVATIESVYLQHQAEQNIENCFICGGGANAILNRLSFEYNHVPDLVLQGLKLWGDSR